MGALMSNPAFLGTVPALAASVIVSLIVLAAGKRGRRAGLLLVAIGLGFLAGFIAIESVPPVVPVTAKQKLFFVAAGLLIGGAILDWRDSEGRLGDNKVRWVLQWLIPVLMLGWLTVRLWENPDLRLVLEFASLLAASTFVLWRLRRQHDAGALGPGVQLLFGAVGLSVVSVIGASASLAMLGSSLAAATGGVLAFVYIVSVAQGRVTGFGAMPQSGGNDGDPE